MKPARTPPAPIQNKQFDLFSSFFGDSKELSNTIELWDAIPKYAVSARQQNVMRDEKGNLPVHEHSFEYRPTTPNAPDFIRCKVSIQPASIQNPDGSYTQHYPSTDEELVEEVLKKIFTDQQFGIHAPQALESWVKFSLYMIQKELRARGKTRSLDQIKTSLEILSSAVYKLYVTGPDGNKLTYSYPILTDMLRTTRTDYINDPKSLWCARLPALISKSINDLTYRQFNYGVLMSLSTPLARWLHKRLSHQYINASLTQTHNLMFSLIHRDSGLLHHSRTAANIRAVDDAFKELQEAKVLWWVKKNERRQGRRITDIRYDIQPSSEFISEIKAANARQRDHRADLAKESRKQLR